MPTDGQLMFQRLQQHYRTTGQVLKGKAAEKFLLKGTVPSSGQERKRKKEYWQTIEWWASLDASARQRIQDALEAHYRTTRRCRPRKPEMEKLIQDALGKSPSKKSKK